MANLSFEKLTPITDADLTGYEEALEYVFSNSDICNIAISGAYSSGKSSVIESYKEKHKEKLFLHISLAHFEQSDSKDQQKNVSSDPEEESATRTPDKIEALIEGKILNQLIQQVDAEHISQTNFHIKRSINVRRIKFYSVAIVCALLIFLYCIGFNKWAILVNSLDKGIIKDLLSYSIIPHFRLLAGVALCILAGIGTFQFIKLQYNRNILRKINIQGNEIEIFSDSDDSYFDKYLNEVLYLFENSGADGIVFEDIDRFDNVTIFERLREINYLTNAKLKQKASNSKSRKKDEESTKSNQQDEESIIRFFYLLRDDIFENKDRTKFFDYILPVIPVLDSSNSYNKIKEYLEKADLYSGFNDHFLRGISLYIDDLRLLKNIHNEFLIYNEKLNTIGLDPNKLYAIITYKNIFPRDFSELQLNRGFVFSMFQNKPFLVKERLLELQKEAEIISDRISAIENEPLESQVELDYVKAGRANKVGHSYTQSYRAHQEWEQNEYPRRMQAIKDKNEARMDELKNQKADLEVKIEHIKHYNLAELIDRENIDTAFQTEFKNELGETIQFDEIKRSPYFDLLKYLLSRGYIDETYFDYMTFFYKNSISINDKIFLRSVADRKALNHDYHLDSPSLVVEYLEEFDFSQTETLNFDLTEYILSNNKSEFIKPLMVQLSENQNFEYVEAYMRSGKPELPFFRAIIKAWPSLFHDAVVTKALSEDLIKELSYYIVENCNESDFEDINIENVLTEYISSDPGYLTHEFADEAKAGENFISIGVVFEQIEGSSAKTGLFEFVYANDLYVLNKPNIELMLSEKCEISDFGIILPDFFSFIRAHNDYPICEYMWNNPDAITSIYFEMYEGDIQDNSETIVEVLNNSEIDDTKKQMYIERLTSKVKDYLEVNNKLLQKSLFINCAVEYTAENIYNYFCDIGLSQELVDFINSCAEELDYNSISSTGKIESFSLACLLCANLSDVKYEQIISNLYDPFDNFSYTNLSKGKVLVLIGMNYIPMNAENLLFMRRAYPDLRSEFIKSDLRKYIVLAKDSAYDYDETLELLEWDEIDETDKIQLLQKTSQPVSIVGRKLNDNIILFILENNFDVQDIPWFLEHYSEYSIPIKRLIKENLGKHIEEVFDVTDCQTDYELLKELISSKDIAFNHKLKLLEGNTKSLNRFELLDILRLLGADKIVNNLEGGNKKVEVTEQNERILDFLQNEEIIEKPEKAIDGYYYKKIRFQ